MIYALLALVTCGALMLLSVPDETGGTGDFPTALLILIAACWTVVLLLQ